MIFYFSGTGNSRWTAQRIAAMCKEPMVDMSVALQQNDLKYDLTSHHSLGWIFPVYGWRPPRLVRWFLQKATFVLPPDIYTYTIMTCGDDIGCTRDVFDRLLLSKGIRLNAAFSIQMPNTYVCLPRFNIDSFAIQQAKIEAASSLVKEIAGDIQQKVCTNRIHKGAFPKLKTYLLNPAFERWLVTDKHFSATKDCIGCGRCSSVCPENNILMQGNRPQWNGTCTMCLACYHHCPQHAIKYGNQTRNKGQYLFETYKKETDKNK